MHDLDLEPDPDIADAILTTDASAEGESCASALRARGFHVVDVPLSLLEARAIGEAPRVIVVDLDQPGALDAVERLRELPAGASAELVCIGAPARAAVLGFEEGSERIFERPVDRERFAALVAKLAAPARAHDRLRPTTPPPSFAPRRDTAAPPLRASEPPRMTSDFPSAEGVEIEAVLAPGGSDVPLVTVEMSPELSKLLSDAEARVSIEPDRPSAAENDVDVLLSPELLAALDEPLDPDADDAGTGSSAVLGTPSATGSVSLGKASAEQSREAVPSGATVLGPPSLPLQSTTGARTNVVDPPRELGFERTPAPVQRGTGVEPIADARGLTPSPEAPPSSRPLPGSRSEWPGLVRAATAADPRSTGPAPSRDARGTGLREASTEAPPSMTEFEPERSSFGWSSGEQARAPQISPEPSRYAVDVPDAEPPPSRLAGPMTRSSSSLVTGERQPGRLEIPAVLSEGDALRALARAISGRASGALALSTADVVRRIVLREGDIVTAASGAPDETLVAFLAARGDLDRDAAVRLAGKLPPFGRHAGAALVAHGHLGQDDLWPVLRAHAEWVIARAVSADEGGAELEPEPPGRLRAEPNVFGGATGAEVLVEIARRTFAPEQAAGRLGGSRARLEQGVRVALLAECALSPEDEELVRSARGRTLGEVLSQAGPEIANVLYALAALDVFEVLAPLEPDASARPRGFDPLDEEAVRKRVRARVSLVEEGDYFALLGVARGATGYEIKRAYLELRRGFEPARLLTAATADLLSDVKLVVEVLDEAYGILKEPARRDRYRRAIEAGPP